MVKHANTKRGETLVVEISCREAWREISEMVDGTLDPAMQRRMELHLKHCSHCRAVYDGTRNTVRLISEEAAFDLPIGFTHRLLARLSHELRHGAG